MAHVPIYTKSLPQGVKTILTIILTLVFTVQLQLKIWSILYFILFFLIIQLVKQNRFDLFQTGEEQSLGRGSRKMLEVHFFLPGLRMRAGKVILIYFELREAGICSVLQPRSRYSHAQKFHFFLKCCSKENVCHHKNQTRDKAVLIALLWTRNIKKINE